MPVIICLRLRIGLTWGRRVRSVWRTLVSSARPIIDTFSDYRAFVAAMIDWLREEDDGVSYRALAERAGFSSKSFLKHVVEGTKNLGKASVPKVAAAVRLTPREERVFQLMVAFNQAKRDDQRKRAYDALMRERRHPVATTERAQFEVYDKWFPMVVRELVGMPGFEEDPAFIGRRMVPKVAAKSVKAAIGLLERVGMLERDEAGQLRQAEVAVSTGPSVRSLAVRSFHRTMLEFASASLDEMPVDRRNITGLMLPLTPEQYRRLCDLISDFRAEVRETFEGGESASEEAPGPLDVYELLVSLVPLTKQVKKR